jgi:hypothetical protein
MQRSRVSKTEAAAVAAEAFVFGYPLVLSEHVRLWMTDVPRPDPVRMKAPINAFAHERELPETTADGVAAPHADTLRSNAWLDLGGGPVVLSVPDTHGRYYAMSVVDLWTNVFASIGARSTGSTPGAYAFVAPRGSGVGLPGSVLPVAAPTRTIRIAALTQVDGAARVAEAHTVQDGFRLEATGAGDGPDAPAGERSRSRTQPVDQVERMDAATFFGELARLMHDNPPRLQDRRVIERMHRVGLLRDLHDGWDALDAETRSAVACGMERGLARVVAAAEAPPGEPVGDWRIRVWLGDFGTDYLARAGAACAGLEPGPAADELPALLETDADGRRLWGRNRYLLRFPPGGLPPVHGLWTLTTYDDRQPLVDNPTDRYSIGDWNGLTLARDGSLAITIQHKPPAGDDAGNWLPAPPGRFNVLLRLVWPMEEALDGRWAPPAVVRTE